MSDNYTKHRAASRSKERDPAAYAAGRVAKAHGRKLANNPHPPGSLAHREWSAGWRRVRLAV